MISLQTMLTVPQVAPSLPVIFLARLLSALAVCSTHPSMGVFVSEIVHPDWRGSMGVVPSIFLALGITKVNASLIALPTYLFFLLSSQPLTCPAHASCQPPLSESRPVLSGIDIGTSKGTHHHTAQVDHQCIVVGCLG